MDQTPEQPEDVVEIELPDGRVVLVDRGDYDRLGLAGRTVSTTPLGYARLRYRGQWAYLHRLIMGFVSGDGKETDHINGDRLDNRRRNLRQVTRQQNNFNKRGYGRHGFKGVGRSVGVKNPWQAQICKSSCVVNLGIYPTVEEAAFAYNCGAAELHGPHARPNDLPPDQLPDTERQAEIRAKVLAKIEAKFAATA